MARSIVLALALLASALAAKEVCAEGECADGAEEAALLQSTATQKLTEVRAHSPMLLSEPRVQARKSKKEEKYNCDPSLTSPPQYCRDGTKCSKIPLHDCQGPTQCTCPTPAPAPQPGTECSHSSGFNNKGENIPPGDNPVSGVWNWQGCNRECIDNFFCVGWTFLYGKCYIKSKVECMTPDDNAESGYCRPSEGPPQCSTPSPTPAPPQPTSTRCRPKGGSNNGRRYTKNYAVGTWSQCNCDNYCDNFCDDQANDCARTCRILNGVFKHVKSGPDDSTCDWTAHYVTNPHGPCGWMVGTGENNVGDNCAEWNSVTKHCRELNTDQNNCRFHQR